MAVVRTAGLEKTYHHGEMEVPALRGVDLTIEAGEFTSLAGPSGSGKTTLLNLIGCLDRATAGELTAGRHGCRRDLPPLQQAVTRREKIGFVFQTYNLIPVLTAFENVELPLVLLGVISEAEIRARVAKDPGRGGPGRPGKPAARPSSPAASNSGWPSPAPLIKEPRLVLADEPTANLDSENAAGDPGSDEGTQRKRSVTFLFSTHDALVMKYARRLITMRDGQIVADERS